MERYEITRGIESLTIQLTLASEIKYDVLEEDNP